MEKDLRKEIVDDLIAKNNGNVACAITTYNLLQYAEMEGMEQDKMLTALSSDKCDGPTEVIASTTCAVCDWFDRDEEAFDMSVSPSDMDLYFQCFSDLCYYVMSELGLGDDAHRYVIAIAAATFALKYQQLTFDEIVGYIENDERPVSAIDTSDSYRILREYGFAISDIENVFNKIDECVKDDDDYIDVALEADKITDKMWSVFEMFLEKHTLPMCRQDRDDVLAFIEEEKEDAKMIWSLSFMLIGLIPRHADAKKCIETDESTAEFMSVLGGEKLKELLSGKHRNGVLQLFKFGFSLQLDAHEHGKPILMGQGGAYDAVDNIN